MWDFSAIIYFTQDRIILGAWNLLSSMWFKMWISAEATPYPGVEKHKAKVHTSQKM